MTTFTGDWYADLYILEGLLRTIEYKTATARMQKFKIKQSEGGSVFMGYTWRGYLSPTKQREYCCLKKKFKTKLLSERPDLWSALEDFRDHHFPLFEFTGIQFNYNYKIGPHKDAANVGQSVLVSCGDYTGGETCVQLEDGTIQKFDARLRPVIFDGSKYTHWVSEFSGERFSVVLFRD
tara:strand:+ start:2701 stop:3237 length:537 start_codon:yes stop_codon:yes gene_type:complete